MTQAAVVTNWVSDPGLEELAGSNHPNSDTLPWFSVREPSGNKGHVGREEDSNKVFAGNYSLRFTEWGEAGSAQDLLLQVDTNAIYEVSYAVMYSDLNENENLTNETALEILFNTSATTNGTYVWRHTLDHDENTGPISNDVWETRTLRFSAADLAGNGGAVQGEYFRIVFRKKDKNSPYKIFVDDVQFGEYVLDPVAPGILLGFHTGIGTNYDYAAAGIGGQLFGANYDGGVINTSGGSSDGTFGTLSGASILPTAYKVRVGNTNKNSRVDFRIINNTGGLLELDSISFDYGRWYENSPKDITLSYAYGNLDEADNTEIYTATNLAVTGLYKDYHDFDIPLTNLNDVVLADGQQATFRLSIDNAVGPWDQGAFDNIAILGTTATAAWFVGSEPSTADQMKLTIYTSGDLSAFSLLGKDAMTDASWSYVAHSDDGVSPYVVTNLSHSTTDGTNRFIYVDAADAKNFYGLEY